MSTLKISAYHKKNFSTFCNYTVAFVAITQIFTVLQAYYEISYYAISLSIAVTSILIFCVSNINILVFDLINFAKIVILSACLSFLNLIYDRPFSSFYLLLCLPLLLLYINKDIFYIIDGFIFWGTLFAFVGYIGGHLGILSGESVVIGDRPYFKYFFTLSDFDFQNSDSFLQRFRFYGVADEPARMGLFLSFSYIFNESKKNTTRSFIVLLLGSLTFSSLFYGILSIYLIFTLIKKARIKALLLYLLSILAFCLFAIFLIENNEFLSFFWYKLYFFNVDSIINRLNLELLDDFLRYGDVYSLFFGLESLANIQSSADSSIISIFLRLGLFGVFVYFIVFFDLRFFLIFLIPLLLFRYNFIFTDIIFMYSLKKAYHD